MRRIVVLIQQYVKRQDTDAMGTHHPNGGAREAGRGRRGAAGVSLRGLRWLAALVPPFCLVHKRAFGWLYILGLVGGAVTRCGALIAPLARKRVSRQHQRRSRFVCRR